MNANEFLEEGSHQRTGAAPGPEGQRREVPGRAEHALQGGDRQFEDEGPIVHARDVHVRPVCQHHDLACRLHGFSAVLDVDRAPRELDQREDGLGPLAPAQRVGGYLRPNAAFADARDPQGADIGRLYQSLERLVAEMAQLDRAHAIVQNLAPQFEAGRLVCFARREDCVQGSVARMVCICISGATITGTIGFTAT